MPQEFRYKSKIRDQQITRLKYISSTLLISCMSTPDVDDRNLSIEFIMTTLPLEIVNASENIHNLAKQMKEKERGSIIITEYATTSSGDNMVNTPVGIITERDIVRKVVSESKDPKTTLASEIMSKPLISVGPEARVFDAALIMTKYKIRRLPVIRDNTLLGIVTTSDLARRMYERNKGDPTLKAMSRFLDVERLAK